MIYIISLAEKISDLKGKVGPTAINTLELDIKFVLRNMKQAQDIKINIMLKGRGLVRVFRPDDK